MGKFKAKAFPASTHPPTPRADQQTFYLHRPTLRHEILHTVLGAQRADLKLLCISACPPPRETRDSGIRHQLHLHQQRSSWLN